ncbi:ATP-dependent DNA helicase [Rhodanobacter sp. OK091]|uniref:ATP-dependent DNA helicase n=1 Tax=Rhodanobacter sp. OK091 TaxID=1881037 RepID=UPI000911E692|nr:ATP-dependent DNA helicase [Rhodanobacter sp. OK091]SHL70955.1 ATP-dependent DNA helicase DinG [Rhodanobacter sp. OK091]
MTAIDDTESDDIGALLGADGPFARELPNFAPRLAQQAMALAVQQAIAGRDTLIAEAGTGTGKTFAYLVPALLSGERVIISTGTKTLQDQLYFRDLPKVRSVLGARLKTALLKGRANYLCLYRLDQTVREGATFERAQAAQLATIRAWSARTRRGDRMELAEVPEESPLWPRVTSTPENCLGVECPFFDGCHVVKARREALEADVVVVNHHLLFADLALKQEGFGEILPGAAAFILDEAHQIPELAGQFFSQSISARQLTELAQDALTECNGITGAIGLLLEPVEALQDALRKLRLAMDVLPARGAFQQLQDRADVRGSLHDLRELLATLAELLASQAERSRGMTNLHERADLFVERLDRIVEGEGGHDHDVRWYETFPRGFALYATPLDLAVPMRDLRERTHAAWIHTSATLSVAGNFDHFARQLGLDDPQTLSLESPFDYARQGMCYLPAGLSDPNARDYTEQVIEAVLPVLHASNGRAFLLFTSHRALRRAAELLQDKVPWPLFVQGTAPRPRLLEEFRASGHGVLLGAASFWEGVDVVGEALSVVVIDKLPFAAPDDPVLMARLEALEHSGINPFMGWQVPSAVIALKQGAGRLIRDVHDRGVLVLCDPRLTTKGYGKLFLASLPPMPRTRELADVRAFFEDAKTVAAGNIL